MQVVALDGKSLGALDSDGWDRLTVSGRFANPFYGRDQVLAARDTIDGDNPPHALAVYRSDSKLVGLFPYRVRRMLPLTWPLAEAAANRYQLAGLPLVADDCTPETLDAWLDALTGTGHPDFWIASHVDLDSPLTSLVASRCARHGLEMRVVGRYLRPRLTRMAGGFSEHVATAIPKRRRRELERCMRRLGEVGELTFERTDDPQLVPRRLEQFLALEHAGWKGRMGTSFLSNTADADFARMAYRNAFVDSLLLNGEPIAISLNVAGGRTAFTPKCTYDETLRRFSPGLVLEYLAVKQFYADERFDEMDAATTVEGHVVAEFWNGFKEMGHVVVGPAGWRTALVAATWEQLLALRAMARSALPRWKEARARRPGTVTGSILSRARAGVERLAASVRAGFGRLLVVGLALLTQFALDAYRNEVLLAGLAAV